MSEVAGEVVIELRPGGLYSTYVLSRYEVLTVMDHLADAVASVDEEAARELVHSLGSVDVGHVLDGWAVFVENADVTIDIGPANPAGHYAFNAEQASTLWRSLAAAYHLASDDIQEMLWQALFGDDGPHGGTL